MARQFFIPAILSLLFSLSSIFAWHRDLTLEALPQCHHDYLQPNNVVVEDVVPTWPGKEIIQATYEHVYVIKADNSVMLTLDIPDVQPNPPHPTTVWGIYEPWVQCWQLQCDQIWREFITGIPAAGDVDNDGLNEIVVGITNWFPFLGPCIPGPFNPSCPNECIGCMLNPVVITNCYSTLVWWKWDGTEFEQHTYDVYQELGIPLYLATPVIARTGMTNGDPTVVFYGPTEWIQEQGSYNVSLQLSSFDLRDPNNPLISISDFFGPLGAGGFDIGYAGPFCVQAGDLTGDGLDELISHTSRAAYAWGWEGNHWDFLPSFNVYVPPPGYLFRTGSFAFADVDADGSLDILAPMTHGAIPPDPFTSRLLQLSSAGVLIRQFGAAPLQFGITRTIPGVADWSTLFAQNPGQAPGTLNPTIQTVAFTDGYIPTGPSFGPSRGWPVGRVNDEAQFMYTSNTSSPVVGDVAGLGYAQLVDATIGHTDIGANELNAYDPRDATNPIAQIDLDVNIPDPLLNIQTPSIPAIVDADADALTEVVVTYRTSEDNLRVLCVDMPSAFNRELAEWEQFQNGPKHKGLYAQPVSGGSPLAYTKWSGRIIVHGPYGVGPSQTLEIEPGTVVEFRPDAELRVWGTLLAEGTPYDSIYFKADGTSRWQGLVLNSGHNATLEHCVIHHCSTAVWAYGNGDLQFMHSRIYDAVTAGVDVSNSGGEVNCQYNDISGSLYGIRGVVSAGYFAHNEIHDCSRAGIYWYGDATSATPPWFYDNTVKENGIPGNGIAGGYFSNTTARLQCNQFTDNFPNQIKCELFGNVVMNDEFGQNLGYNILEADASEVWCGVPCPPPPPFFYPLMWLYKSEPHMKYSHTTFRFLYDGTFIFDVKNRCPVNYLIGLEESYYETNGSLADPPSPTNIHFCPTTGFEDGNPLSESLPCNGGAPSGLTGATLAYQQAADAERGGNVEQARNLFGGVVNDYPQSAEALWATRSYLRTGLADEIPFLQQHDSLFALWQDETLPFNVREAARREAAWALIAGEDYGTARTELESITAEEANEDSLWAAVTLELVTLLEQGGMGIQSVGHEQPMQARITQFHERLHELMGRQTDEELLAQAAIPKSHDLATAYPNPFNSTVTIQFELPEAGEARLEIFNLMGQKVATVLDQRLESGTYTRPWNASDVPSGVYFIASTRISTQRRTNCCC